jgi:predicted PurR-regulated permease PerM
MRVVAFCLVLLSTLAGFAVLVYLEDILIPFTFAFFLACVLEPLQRLVIRTGMRVARACAACVASLRKSGGDRERGTAAEREPLTGTHVQQEPIASELVGLSLRQRSPSASAACAVLALRMAGVVVCVLALVSCLTGFVAVSTFELERLATLADTQDWDRRGEALVNETIRLVNRTHLPPSQIEDYVRSGLAEVPGVVKAVLLGLGNFSVDLLLVCVIVFFMLWSRAAAHVHTAAVIDDPLATPRTTEAHRHRQARIEPSRLQGSIQVRKTASFLRFPYVFPDLSWQIDPLISTFPMFVPSLSWQIDRFSHESSKQTPSLQAQIRTYFQLKTLTSLLLGAAVGISLLVLGVPGSGAEGRQQTSLLFCDAMFCSGDENASICQDTLWTHAWQQEQLKHT